MNNKLILLVVFLSILIINYLSWYQTWKLVIKNKNWYKSINVYLLTILYVISMNLLLESKDKLINNSTFDIVLSFTLFFIYMGTAYYLEKKSQKQKNINYIT